jgi:hypothetical protein
MSDDLVLTESSYTATINVPIDWVDIGDWLLHLPDQEYQRCAPPDHVAAGFTTTDDGRPMSINVEQIGSSLMVQHYVGEIVRPDHCHMVSERSDVYTQQGRTYVGVAWTLRVRPIDDGSCEYSNTVVGTTTPEFLEFLARYGISIEDAQRDRQAAASEHNSRETPRYAASIERHGRTRHQIPEA